MEDSFVLGLLEAALKRRENMCGVTNVLRLVNGFGDGMDGLVLEQYGRHCVAQVMDQRWLKHYEVITRFVKESCNAEYFIIKERIETISSDPNAINMNVWLDGGSSKTIVEENGLKFGVDLNDTLNSGLFLDMRANRHMLARSAQGRKVLNGFSYTCSFGVHCRAQGASAVVNVDVSKKILERGRYNYELNGLVPEKNEFIRADVVEYLERAVKKDNRFDMIILDPPSFARHEGKIFSVKKDMPRLIGMAASILNPKGILFIATNYSGMEHEHIEDMIIDACGKRTVERLERFGQDEDFIGSGSMPESYLAAVLAEVI